MQREVIIVCGVTGSGKSVWSKHLTAKMNRLMVYDTLSEFPVTYMDAEGVAAWAEKPPAEFRIGVYNPYDTDVLTAAAYVVGNCMLVLEEISTLYKIGARIDGPLQEAVLLGRHRRLSILAIAQRASYVPVTLRSQASRIVSFRQQEPTDLKWMEEFLGKENAQSLPTLPDLHCIDWHKGNVSKYTVPIPGRKSDPTQSNIDPPESDIDPPNPETSPTDEKEEND